MPLNGFTKYKDSSLNCCPISKINVTVAVTRRIFREPAGNGFEGRHSGLRIAVTL